MQLPCCFSSRTHQHTAWSDHFISSSDVHMPARRQHEQTAATGSSGCSGFAMRGISTSSAALKDVMVEVPSMGESITEGAVAAILKQPGAQSRDVVGSLSGLPKVEAADPSPRI